MSKRYPYKNKNTNKHNEVSSFFFITVSGDVDKGSTDDLSSLTSMVNAADFTFTKKRTHGHAIVFRSSS